MLWAMQERKTRGAARRAEQRYTRDVRELPQGTSGTVPIPWPQLPPHIRARKIEAQRQYIVLRRWAASAFGMAFLAFGAAAPDSTTTTPTATPTATVRTTVRATVTHTAKATRTASLTDRASTPAPKPKPKATKAHTAAPEAACDPNYAGCVPTATDVDCEGGSGNGPAYVAGPLKVTGTDVYDLDPDGDGVACE